MFIVFLNCGSIKIHFLHKITINPYTCCEDKQFSQGFQTKLLVLSIQQRRYYNFK